MPLGLLSDMICILEMDLLIQTFFKSLKEKKRSRGGGLSSYVRRTRMTTRRKTLESTNKITKYDKHASFLVPCHRNYSQYFNCALWPPTSKVVLQSRLVKHGMKYFVAFVIRDL